MVTIESWRENNPKSFALARIGECWDRVDSRYKKHGNDEQFNLLLAELKNKIAVLLPRYGVSRREFKEYKTRNGYNFNYGKYPEA